jgi:hypothetical protein
MGFLATVLQVIGKRADSLTVLVRSFESKGQKWYRATVLNTENDTLFLSGVNTDQEAVTEKAKAWCNENGFPFKVKTEAH